MFLLKLSTLSAAIFLFVSLVLLPLCGRSTGVFHQLLLFFSIRYQTLISDIDKFILALLLFDRPDLNFVYESRHSLALHEYVQGGQQQFFIIVFFSIRYQTLISDIDTFLLALFIVSLELKSKVFKVCL